MAERGRIVLLADNDIVHNDRLRLQACAAAEAGWDVTVLGRVGAAGEPGWQWGRVSVRLLPMPTPLGELPHRFRRSLLRSPLAYPPGPTCAYRVQKVKARRVDLDTRRAVLDMADGSGVAAGFARSRWRMADAAARATEHWVGMRERRSMDAVGRGDRDTQLDRVATGWWNLVRGKRSWRSLDPSLWDYELGLGGNIDRLMPDIIHVTSSRMLGVAARARARGRAAGRDVSVVWDVAEYLPHATDHNGRQRAWAALCAHESEYVAEADAIIAVSDDLAELLRKQHRLPVRPAVVLSAPDLTGDWDATARTEADPTPPHGFATPQVPDVRRQCGIADSTRLLVYCGRTAPAAGLDVAVEALSQLPEVHLAIATDNPESPYVERLREMAAAGGTAGRLHVLTCP
ncbi:MAG: glycosyltransferase, partial [Stackebrandtia sp.]